MKSVSRISLWLALLLCLAGVTAGPVSAQVPNPKNDPVFAKAKEQETQNPSQAMDTYVKIKNENARSNRELAAEALYRASVLGLSILSATPPAAQSPMDRQRNEDLQFIVGDKAHEAIKHLFNELGDTEAAKAATQTNLKTDMENRIDRRNSIRPTYKIIDGLVAATGRIPQLSYWLALVLIAVSVTLLTWPLKLRMYKSQREMQRIQPILKEIQEKYKGKPELNEKVMATYKEHNVNPFSSCLPMFIQLPFLWWVYSMIRMYEFHFSHGTFLWIGSGLEHQFPGYVAANLGQFDYALLFIYAGSNYLTMKLTPPSDPAMAQQQKTMAVMMTGMMIYFFLMYKWTAAFMLYWLALNLLSAWQQYYYIYRPNKMATAGGGPTDITRGPGASSNGEDTRVSRTGSAPRNVTNGKTGSSGVQTVTPVPGGDQMRARPRRKRRT